MSQCKNHQLDNKEKNWDSRGHILSYRGESWGCIIAWNCWFVKLKAFTFYHKESRLVCKYHNFILLWSVPDLPYLRFHFIVTLCLKSKHRKQNQMLPLQCSIFFASCYIILSASSFLQCSIDFFPVAFRFPILNYYALCLWVVFYFRLSALQEQAALMLYLRK